MSLAEDRGRKTCLNLPISTNAQGAKKASLTYHKIRRLEPLTAALGREKDPKNIALHQVFAEHIDSSKEDLCTFMKEATSFAYGQKATEKNVMENISK
jgi:hypothetical protein